MDFRPKVFGCVGSVVDRNDGQFWVVAILRDAVALEIPVDSCLSAVVSRLEDLGLFSRPTRRVGSDGARNECDPTESSVDKL